MTIKKSDTSEKEWGDFQLGEISLRPGERKDIKVKITELYMATPLFIPVTVFQGARPGPVLFVTAALHGNELNGIEIVRQVRTLVKAEELSGTLILVSIANPISFINQTRDLPDGRDLNRAFPGFKKGSMASQIAYALFEKVVKGADYGIDLHTAAGRTNLPHVRADMSLPEVKRLARAFGNEVIFDMAGERTTLRYQACQRGIPTIVYEAGEPMKFQKGLIAKGVQGVLNVLMELNMLKGRPVLPPQQLTVKHHRWIRADKGGILMMNVKPGDIIRKGEAIAYNTKPFGTELDVVKAPFTGLVVGVTTIPMVISGSAVCHLLEIDHKVKAIHRMTEKMVKDGEEE